MVVGSDGVKVAFVGGNNKKSFYPLFSIFIIFRKFANYQRLRLPQVKRNLISSKNIYSEKAFFESCFTCCGTTYNGASRNQEILRKSQN